MRKRQSFQPTPEQLEQKLVLNAPTPAQTAAAIQLGDLQLDKDFASFKTKVVADLDTALHKKGIKVNQLDAAFKKVVDADVATLGKDLTKTLAVHPLAKGTFIPAVTDQITGKVKSLKAALDAIKVTTGTGTKQKAIAEATVINNLFKAADSSNTGVDAEFKLFAENRSFDFASLNTARKA
jgi:hypothetical protein